MKVFVFSVFGWESSTLHAAIFHPSVYAPMGLPLHLVVGDGTAPKKKNNIPKNINVKYESITQPGYSGLADNVFTFGNLGPG